MTAEFRLKQHTDLLEKQKLWKARIEALPFSAAEFCRRHKSLKTYEANLSRACNLEISPRKKKHDEVEAALKKEEALIKKSSQKKKKN